MFVLGATFFFFFADSEYGSARVEYRYAGMDYGCVGVDRVCAELEYDYARSEL